MEDSWKTNGDCEVCRRKSYCSKSCTRHKEFYKKYVWEKMKEAYGEDAMRGLDKEMLFARLVEAISNGSLRSTEDGVPLAE